MKHSALSSDIDIREMFDVENLKMLFINLEKKAKMKYTTNNIYDSNNNCNINNRTGNTVSIVVPKIKLHYTSTNKMKLKLKNMLKKKFIL